MIRITSLAVACVITGCHPVARSSLQCPLSKYDTETSVAKAASLQGTWDIMLVDTTADDRSVIRPRTTARRLVLHHVSSSDPVTFPFDTRKAELIGLAGSQPAAYANGILYFGWGDPGNDHPHALTHRLILTRASSSAFEGTWQDFQYQQDLYIDTATGKTYPPAAGYFCATRSR